MITLDEIIKNRKAAIHTPLLDQAKILCTELDRRGIKWEDGTSYLSLNNWNINKEKTCYRPSDGVTGTTLAFEYRGSIVYEFDEISDFQKRKIDDIKAFVSFKKNIYIPCETFEKSQVLLMVLQEKGFAWHRILEHWYAHQERTCYGITGSNKCIDFGEEEFYKKRSNVVYEKVIFDEKTKEFWIESKGEKNMSDKTDGMLSDPQTKSECVNPETKGTIPFLHLPFVVKSWVTSEKDKVTTVVFNDGSKIVVRRNDGDKDSIESAVAFATMKLIYGSNSRFGKFVALADQKAKDEKDRIASEKAEKAKKQAIEARKAKKFKNEVKRRAHDLLVEKEALKLLNAKKEKK